jgi:thiamine-phosphate pyrophosphorylase
VSLPSSPPARPILCYVTDRHSLAAASGSDPRQALLDIIENAAAAGINWIQIREKDLSAQQSFELVQESHARVASTTVPPRILVNDRLDIALAAKAGGVHLGELSLPVANVRRFFDSNPAAPDFLLGVSCHSLEAAEQAARDGADYLIFGPVFATPSKSALGAPQGLERLAAVCAAVKVPVLAIGGITLDNASSCLTAGVAGIAAIRLFQDAHDLARLVRSLRQFPG